MTKSIILVESGPILCHCSGLGPPYRERTPKGGNKVPEHYSGFPKVGDPTWDPCVGPTPFVRALSSTPDRNGAVCAPQEFLKML